MNLDIKLHKQDLPDDLKLGNSVSLDCEMGGLNVNRDLLHLVQISTGNSDAHIIQLNRSNYKAPNLVKLLQDKSTKKIFNSDNSSFLHLVHFHSPKTRLVGSNRRMAIFEIFDFCVVQ